MERLNSLETAAAKAAGLPPESVCVVVCEDARRLGTFRREVAARATFVHVNLNVGSRADVKSGRDYRIADMVVTDGKARTLRYMRKVLLTRPPRWMDRYKLAPQKFLMDLDEMVFTHFTVA